MDPNIYPTTKQERLSAFEEWMRKVRNVHQSDNTQMTAAYEYIE